MDQAAAPPPLPSFRDTVGALIVAIFICASLTSCLCGEAMSYSSSTVLFKGLVAFLCLMVTGEVAMYCSWVYLYAVDYFARPEMLAFVPWQMTATPSYAGAIAAIVHGFFAWRVWKVSSTSDRGWRPFVIPGLIIVAASIAFGSVMYLAKLGQNFNTMDQLEGYYPLAYIWFITAAVADLLITATLWYYLTYKAPNLLESTRNMFQRIVLRAAQTNALSLMCQVAIPALMVYGEQTGLYFAVPAFLMGPVYFFSLLVTLNTRNERPNGASIGPTLSATSEGWNFKTARSRTNKSAHGVQISVNQDITVDLEQQSFDDHSASTFHGGVQAGVNRQPFVTFVPHPKQKESENEKHELREM
ncbi:hypothetical protein ACM66B_003993 [Microbotryomycetes sp. NB124-2]